MFFLFMVLAVEPSMAQSKKYEKIPKSILSMGITYPVAQGAKSNRVSTGSPGYYLEMRWMLGETPLDMSIYAATTLEAKQFNGDLTNRYSAFNLFVDYNLDPGMRVNPFIGIGAGASVFSEKNGGQKAEGSRMLACRFGVHFQHWLDLSLDYGLLDKGTNQLYFRVGWYFGWNQYR